MVVVRSAMPRPRSLDPVTAASLAATATPTGKHHMPVLPTRALRSINYSFQLDTRYPTVPNDREVFCIIHI
jgi:hypothetical protein